MNRTERAVIVWKPQPRQLEFMRRPEPEALYGGAAGGGLEHIVKQLGYGDDPLNQRASVGWKGMRAAERLVEQYMVRIESVSSYSATAAAN